MAKLQKELLKCFQKSYKKGFTLIEATIVIFLVSILIFSNANFFKTLILNYKLKSASYDLFSNIQFTKSYAIKNGHETAIFFDPAKNSYTIYKDNGGDNSWSNGNETILKTIYFDDYNAGISFGYGNAKFSASTNKTFPDDNISYSSPDNILIFNSYGMADNLGYVYLQNKIGESFVIGTPSISGIVILKKWNGASWSE